MEVKLLEPAVKSLKKIAKNIGLEFAGGTMSLDGVYNSRENRKTIFNLGMTPNMPENKRNRKKTKRGRRANI
ncbi:hypothetical protein SZ25_00745 [Candidatus Arcanobacter lacustris]|uniref:Uncharacterized protein n=1 Tax=Candidatus Arcanibacter lacustris TaxID=1607817 RepID=A0A0F5MN76_9RICK|nr:hypothetical protein SZ25_00745 [Candidatus Arcanobacter lacustris]